MVFSCLVALVSAVKVKGIWEFEDLSREIGIFFVPLAKISMSLYISTMLSAIALVAYGDLVENFE